MTQKCGKSDFRRAGSIEGGITFGSGMIDDYGFWQFPCRVCAEDFDARIEEIKEGIRQELLFQEQLPLTIAQHIASQDWLFIPAWPRADQDVNKLIENSRDYFALLAAEREEAFRDDMRYDEEEAPYRRQAV